MSNQASARQRNAENAVIVHDWDKLKAELEKDAEPVVATLGGKRFEVPNPLLWPDDVVEMQQTAATDPRRFPMVAFAKRLLGDRYDEWVEVGGTPVLFMRGMDDALGQAVGESSAS